MSGALSAERVVPSVRELKPSAAPKKKRKIYKKIKPRRLFDTDGSLVVDLALRVKSPNRSYLFRMANAGETRRVRKHVMKALACVDKPLFIRSLTMTRYSPSKKGLDRKDNLEASLKAVRDQAVCWLDGNNALSAKANDGAECPYRLEYDQQQHEAYGVRLVFR